MIKSSAAEKIFCFGFGQCARALAEQGEGLSLHASFRDVAGSKARQAVIKGVQPVSFAKAGAALKACGTMIISIAPKPVRGSHVSPDPVLRHYRQAIATAKPKQIIYLSSSAVYGDKQGSRVSEFSPACPQDEVSRRRLQAEQDWQSFARHNKIPLVIFRLAGLYGAAQNPLRRLMRQRRPRIWHGQKFSRIHTKDVAYALRAVLQQPPQQTVEIFNLCDDAPAPQSEVVRFAARLLGLPSPPLVPLARAKLSPMALNFYARRKILSNQRIKARFGLNWHYPTYREGLVACLAELNTS